MKHLKRISRRAVTLTELLVVLAIISLLATIAVPVYLGQIQQARFAVAQSEVRAIAEAQQQVAITHGFIVPIHILDNIPNRDAGSGGVGGSATSRDDFDNLTNASGHFVIKAGVPLEDQVTSQLNLGSNDSAVQRMIINWQGPFLNPQRVYYVGQRSAGDPRDGDITLDIVIDPWGNPYRLYTDLGITGSNPPSQGDTLVNPTLAMDNGDLSNDEANRFDRFGIVSFGPNGYSDFNSSDPLDTGDDIFYTFSGIVANETSFRAF